MQDLTTSGIFQEYLAASDELNGSFGSLVNNNDWIKIHWTDATFGEDGTPVKVDGKDVTTSLSEIDAKIAELESNIPKYTTDPSLAEASLGCLSSLKSKFDEIRTIDKKTLEIKADNQEINSRMPSKKLHPEKYPQEQTTPVMTNSQPLLQVLTVSLILLRVQ